MFVVKATSATGQLFSLNPKADMRTTDAQQIITAGRPDKPSVSRCARSHLRPVLIVGTSERTGGGGKAAQRQ